MDDSMKEYTVLIETSWNVKFIVGIASHSLEAY